MKITQSLVLIGGLLTAGNFAFAKPTDASVEKKGTVQRLLTNASGDVDGFLLTDGTQVSFPPSMSSQLTAIIAAKDKVAVKGYQENAKVLKAEKITNTKTSQTIADTAAPMPPQGLPGKDVGTPLPPPPGAPAAPGTAHAPPPIREGLKQYSVQGKIQSQIFGPRGEVNGVVLSDNSIVHFAPASTNDGNLKTNVGEKIKATGMGTENSYGKSIEATEISNN